jgi:hypothetical protein
MAAIDLNLLLDLEVHEAIDWSSIDGWGVPAYELDCDLVWDNDGHEGGIHLFSFYDSYVFVRSRSLSLLHAWISDQGHDLGEGGEEQVAGHAFDLNIASHEDADEGHAFDLNVGELEGHISIFLAHA